MDPRSTSLEVRRARIRDQIRAAYAADPNLEGDGVYDHPAWRDDLRELFGRLSDDPDRRVLDAGCGSGGFSRFLAVQTGRRVLGIDADDRAIARARDLAAGELTRLVEHRVIDVEAPDASFPRESFAAISCSKVACHFTDPLGVFRAWREWLAPNGVVAVVDGLWHVGGWTGLAHVVDDLPISCQQTMGTITYLLEETGFVVEYSQRLARVNDATERGDLPRSSGPLYLVIARAT